MLKSGNVSIDAQNIMPIIKKWMYSDKDIFVREMVSNGCDAVTKEKMLHPGEECDWRVTVTLDEAAKELRFEDNGIGMTADEVDRFINQVAFSGAEEFLKNYQGEDKNGIIGHFGLGFYSAFMVADKVTIDTLSGTEGATPVRWVSEDGMGYTMEEGTRTERGTCITLHLNEDAEEFLEEYRLHEVLHRYCGFMNTPVYFEVIAEEVPVKDADHPEDFTSEEGGEEAVRAAKAMEEAENKHKAPERINAIAPLWLKAPKDCTAEEYKQFYKDVFHRYDDPLFWVHLNVDYPFNLKGILYFPKLTEDFGTREGEIKLFSGQVFVADNIKEVIPEFLMLLKGVIDCPDLPLNVSRSFLQNDGYVKKLSAYITRKVADKLTGLFNTERENYQKYWEDIHPFVKYGCLRDSKFYDQVKETLLYKTTGGDYLTLKEYLSKNEGKISKKVIYTSDPARQSASIAMYDAEGISVVIMDALIDLNFMGHIEMNCGESDLHFVRVDADSDTFRKVQTPEDKVPTEEETKAAEELFRKVTGDEELKVKLETLKDAATPAMLTQDEQGRRFNDMSKIYGQSFKLPETFTLILNSENPVIQYLMNPEADAERKDLLAAQLYDLSRMSSRPLEKDEITAFITRSAKLMSLLTEK